MASLYYYDTAGRKVGPISSNVLKSLAEQGVITPETVIENEQGKSAKAREISELVFPPHLMTLTTASPDLNNDSPDPSELDPTVRSILKFAIAVIGVVAVARMIRAYQFEDTKSSKGTVSVLIDATADRPLHGATYEVWINGKLADSQDLNRAVTSFTVEAPVGRVEIMGKVKYKNGYGVVMDERRISRTVDIKGREFNKVELEVYKY